MCTRENTSLPSQVCKLRYTPACSIHTEMHTYTHARRGWFRICTMWLCFQTETLLLTQRITATTAERNALHIKLIHWFIRVREEPIPFHLFFHFLQQCEMFQYFSWFLRNWFILLKNNKNIRHIKGTDPNKIKMCSAEWYSTLIIWLSVTCIIIKPRVSHVCE